MGLVPRTRFAWQLRTRSLALGERTRVMAILNVTPDSFSDGGRFAGTEAAVAHAIALLDEGADVLDVGGESTRPGATALSADQEQDRVLPVIEAVLKERPGTVVSIDTYHAATARAAVVAGAEIVNDVSGFTWDATMAAACAELHCGVVLMHTRGTPAEWAAQPPLDPDALLPAMHRGLQASLDRAAAAGIAREAIVLDPGYGFGKRGDENFTLLARQAELLALGRPLVAGVSRKSFLGRALTPLHGGKPAPVDARETASLAALVAAILHGASLVRVHTVRPAVEAALIADQVLGHMPAVGSDPY